MPLSPQGNVEKAERWSPPAPEQPVYEFSEVESLEFSDQGAESGLERVNIKMVDSETLHMRGYVITNSEARSLRMAWLAHQKRQEAAKQAREEAQEKSKKVSDFDKYQHEAFDLAIYPEVGNKSISGITYTTLGLTGEAGEVAEKVKKILRDDGGVVQPQTKKALKEEIGDVLWYLSVLAAELDLSLADVAEGNLEKLHSRKDRGSLQGSGDDR